MEKVESRGVVALAAVVAKLLLPPFGAAAPAAASTGPGSSCTRFCSNISIPYPFGVEPGCYHDGFNLTCDHSYQPPKLFLGDGTVQVLDISLPNGTVRINSSRLEFAVDDGGSTVNMTWGSGLPQDGPYFLSKSVNSVVVLGCDIQVDLRGKGHNNLIGSCTAICPSDDRGLKIASGSACTGIGCCQIDIVLGYSFYDIQIQHLNGSFSSNSGYIYMVDGAFNYRISEFPHELPEALPVTLDWVVSNSTCPIDGSVPECRSAHSSCRSSTAADHGGYLCQCVDESQGNPYVVGGCQGTTVNQLGFSNPWVHESATNLVSLIPRIHESATISFYLP